MSDSTVQGSAAQWPGTPMEQNLLGYWVPSIPVPLHLAFGRKECTCRARFWRLRRYREHYAYTHIQQGVPA